MFAINKRKTEFCSTVCCQIELILRAELKQSTSLNILAFFDEFFHGNISALCLRIQLIEVWICVYQTIWAGGIAQSVTRLT